MTDPIRFTLDGNEIEAEPGETIWQVANRQGVEIPHLCWLPEPGYRADERAFLPRHQQQRGAWRPPRERPEPESSDA